MNYSEGSLCAVAPLRFLCDEMLRGVGNWLRIAGYDTVSPAEGVPDSVVLADAIRQDRWLITRDYGLQQQPFAAQYVILLKTGNLQANLQELAGRIDIDWLYRPFSRCKRCNTPLVSKDLAFARGRIPADIAQRVNTLRYCPTCDRLYWEGSHVQRMRRRLTTLSRDSTYTYAN